jgi:hypothetical protein
MNFSTDLAAIPPRATPRREDGHSDLHGPLVDFVCLGGASMLLLPLLLLLPDRLMPTLSVLMLVVIATVVNFPHFVHSYQIFYRGFGIKVSRSNPDPALRWRHIAAGFVAPTLIAAALATAVAFRDTRQLGLCASAMGFFVGWHYVKQGYGILVIDATLKRRSFSATERQILLANAYTVWIASWITANAMLEGRELWGVKYLVFPLPMSVVWAAWAVAATMGAGTLWSMVKRCRDGGDLPWTGLAAYVASLYFWQLFVVISPVWLLVVPSLHSLQYLTVVLRFEANRAKDAPGAMVIAKGRCVPRSFRARYRQRVLGFSLTGVLIGLLLFWGAPLLLEEIVAPHQEHHLLFFFVVWTFVNVHHYFLDGVTWRSRNPETRKYLFTARIVPVRP